MRARRLFELAMAVLWLWSGLQPPLTAWDASLVLLARVGVPGILQTPALLASCALDVLLGLLCILAPGRRLWLAQLVLVGFYSVIVAFMLSENWLHPFAPLLKNLPIAAALWWLVGTEQEKML